MGQMCSLLTGTGVQCEKTLECGHTCTQQRSHRNSCTACRKNCLFVYPCGHRCRKRCGGKTRPELSHEHSLDVPCKQLCQLRCLHGAKCTAKCSEPCSPCKAKCILGCQPHGTCSRACGDWMGCQKPRGCEEPCPETCTCGTKCVGLCGHPCPPCPTCSPFICPISLEEFGAEKTPALTASKRLKTGKKVTRPLPSKKEQNPDLQAYTLKDCGCTFELKLLDVFMSKEVVKMLNKKEKTIKCPNCRKQIMTSPRYAQEIRRLAFHDHSMTSSASYEPVSPTELSMVIKTMGVGYTTTQGQRQHWYKCPKGHPFYVGDCGNPTEAGWCNECKVKIGSENGKLLGKAWDVNK